VIFTVFFFTQKMEEEEEEMGEGESRVDC